MEKSKTTYMVLNMKKRHINFVNSKSNTALKAMISVKLDNSCFLSCRKETLKSLLQKVCNMYTTVYIHFHWMDQLRLNIYEQVRKWQPTAYLVLDTHGLDLNSDVYQTNTWTDTDAYNGQIKLYRLTYL